MINYIVILLELLGVSMLEDLSGKKDNAGKNKSKSKKEDRLYTFESTLRDFERVRFEDVDVPYDQFIKVVENLPFESPEQLMGELNKNGISCSAISTVVRSY